MEYISLAEAAVLYEPSKRTIERKVGTVASNPEHPMRDHVLPSASEYKTIKEEGGRYKFLATVEILDRLFPNKRAEKPSKVTSKIAGVAEKASSVAADVVGASDVLRELVEQLKAQVEEKDKQLLRKDDQISRKDDESKVFIEALREMTLTQRGMNTLVARLQDQLPEPKPRQSEVVVRDAVMVNEKKKPRATSKKTKAAKPTAKRGRGVFGIFGRSKKQPAGVR